MFVRFCCLLLIFSAIFGAELLAKDTSESNFRELCRKTISGQYSNALADKTLAEDAVKLASEAIQKSKNQIKTDETKLNKLNEKIRSSEYTPELINERDMINAQLKLYQEQLTTSQSQLKSAQKLAVTSKKRIESIRKKVESIFIVTMFPDPEGGPRPMLGRIEWKSSCPKYRVLCPLPAKDAQTLKELRKEIDDSDLACDRYSKLK